MSTKTTIKRIALVAAVAAAFGGLSTVAANAVSTSSTATVLATGLLSGGANTAAGTQVVGGIANVTITETTTGTAAAGDILGTVSTSGVGTIAGSSTTSTKINLYTLGSSDVAATYPGTSYSLEQNASGYASVSGDQIKLTLTSAVAGVQTISFAPISSTGAPGTAVTATITWGAAPVVSAQYSTAYIHAETAGGAAAQTASDSTAISASKSATTVVADVLVQLNSAASTPITGQGLSVSVSGPGLVAIGDTTSIPSAGVGRAVSTASTDINSQFDVGIFADGTTGFSTITISSGTTVIATKTVTFTGSAAKVTAVQNLKVLKAGLAASAGGSSATAGLVYSGAGDAADATTVLSSATVDTGVTPITVTTFDSAGNPVAITPSSTTIKLVSSDTSVITVPTSPCQTSTGATITAAGVVNNQLNCYVLGTVGAASGKSATVTVELYDSTTAAWDFVAAPLTFTIGGAVTKEVVTTDSASYTPGQPLVLTVTTTDASGNAPYDQDGAAITSLGSSVYMNGLIPPKSIIGGVGTVKTGIYAPSVEGNFTISGLDNLSAAGEAVSVTATVAGGAATTQASAATDAANEATDAANAAADAADAATAAAQDAGAKADAALAAVTALSAKITVLAAQIAKIVKKLKA